MDFVETKFFYKNHVLEFNLKNKNMSKKWLQKPRNCSLNHIHIKKIIYIGKVPKVIFEKLTQKLINFEVFLVGKVPKSSFINRECSES